MTTDYPVHWLVCSMGKTGSRYKRVAFAWALNFMFKDYCLLPAEFFELIFNRYHAKYPLTVLRSMLDWLKSPVGSDRFRPVTAGRLTREMADRFTSYLRNNKGIAEGRGIALLQYLRARYHSAVTTEQGLVRVAELMVMLSLPLSLNKDAMEDTSRYNWFMAMHLLYGYGNRQMSLRDLEHLYRVFPEYSGSVPFRNNRDSLARITTVGREGLSLTVVDLRDIIRSITFANRNYALALYSLLRSLRKYGHPMAAYATKIIAF
nr:MAG TPA: hypothetical protein [Caudoviricetes sp.]